MAIKHRMAYVDRDPELFARLAGGFRNVSLSISIT